MENLQENKNVLLVTEINSGNDTVNGALGITDERSEELVALANDANPEKDSTGRRGNVAHTLELISQQCRHANELAWICFIIGANVGERQANPMSGFMRALKASGRNPLGE